MSSHERGVARRAHLRHARAPHGLRRRACAATASWAASSCARTARSSRSPSLGRRSGSRVCDGSHRHPARDPSSPRGAPRRPRGRGQVRLVRRLPADAARSRGPAARDHRALRHRRVRRGNVQPLARSVRRAARRRLDQHARPGRGNPPAAPRGDAAGDDRRLRHERRHPGAAQPGRPRRVPRRGLPAARSGSSRWPRRTPVSDHVAVDAELFGCPISPAPAARAAHGADRRSPAAAARRGRVRRLQARWATRASSSPRAWPASGR